MSSWFFGQPTSSLPPITPLQEQRSKQIASLRALNPNVVELKCDVEYRVSFSLQGHTIALEILLPPQFPQDKPEVKVSPPVRHPWVNDSMQVVGCSSLIQFGVHTDLGRVIQEIVSEFNQHPPMVFPTGPNQQPVINIYQPYAEAPVQHALQPGQLGGQMYSPNLPPPGPQVNSSSISHIEFPSTMEDADNHNPTPTYEYSSSPMTQPLSSRVPYLGVVPNCPPPELLDPNCVYKMPAMPANFNKLLGSASKEDLQALLEREDRIMDLAQQLPEIKYLFDQRNYLFQACEELAKQNLSYKPELETRRKTLLVQEEEQRRLHESFHHNCMKQQSLNQNFEPQLLLDNLKVAASDAEHQSDAFAEDFLDGKVPLEEFLRKFSDTRKMLHLRKVKEEKLDHMIRNRTIKYS